MSSVFDDEFVYKRLFSRMVKEVRKEQLNKTIDEINYLNEIRSSVLSRCDFDGNQNEQLEFIKKLRTAKRNNAIKKCFKN